MLLLLFLFLGMAAADRVSWQTPSFSSSYAAQGRINAMYSHETSFYLKNNWSQKSKANWKTADSSFVFIKHISLSSQIHLAKHKASSILKQSTNSFTEGSGLFVLLPNTSIFLHKEQRVLLKSLGFLYSYLILWVSEQCRSCTFVSFACTDPNSKNCSHPVGNTSCVQTRVSSKNASPLLLTSSTSNRFWYTSRDICWMCTFLAVEVAQHNEKPQPLTTLYLKMTAGAQNCLHKQYTAGHCCWCNNGQPKGTKAVAETPPARFSRNFLNENMLNMAKMTSRTIFIRNSKSSAIARSFS